MKLIDAFWEQNNLGVKSLEVIIDEKDEFIEIKDSVEMNLYDYIVFKVTNQNINAIFKLQEEGFIFIETQISLTINPSIINTDRFKKLARNFSFEKVETHDSLNGLVNSISEDMFSTDRIALDPRFGLTLANKRYKKWILGEYGKKNTEIFKVNKKEKNIGFVMMNISNEKEINILLGGVYSEFQGLGYGWNIVYQPIEYYSKLSANTLKTKVSSNNLEVLKLYIAMGYQVEGLNYIFIKHKEEKNEN